MVTIFWCEAYSQFESKLDAAVRDHHLTKGVTKQIKAALEEACKRTKGVTKNFFAKLEAIAPRCHLSKKNIKHIKSNFNDVITRAKFEFACHNMGNESRRQVKSVHSHVVT